MRALVAAVVVPVVPASSLVMVWQDARSVVRRTVFFGIGSPLSLGPYAALTSSDESVRAKFEPRRFGRANGAQLNRTDLRSVEAVPESRSR